jgi:uncharacterized membrane protein YgcG
LPGRIPIHATTPHLRRLVAVAFATATALCAPAAAHAASSSASVYWGVLSYHAAPGDANHVVVTSSASTVTLTDSGPGVTITPSYGCTGGGSTVTCSGVWTMNLSVGDGDNDVDTSGSSLGVNVTSGAGADDILTGPHADFVNAGGGNDVIDGGAGTDTLYGGAGADTFSARDGEVDHIHCGTEADGGKADPTDSIDADCESVATTDPPPGGEQPSGGGGTNTGGSGGTGGAGGSGGNPTGSGGGGSTSGAGEVNLAPPVLPKQSPAVSKKGVALVRVACPTGAGRCRGSVALFLVKGRVHASAVVTSARRRGRHVSSARRRTPRRIGHAKFSVAAGHAAAVPIKLDRRGRRRVMRHRKLRVRMQVTTHTASGRAVRTSRTITLHRRVVRRGRS